MLICPNKNLKEWKDLVASVGENRAMLMWYESEGKVGFTLSAQTTILDNLSKVNNWFKQMKDTDAFWNKLQKDLQIPKEQISLLKESNGKTIEEKLTNFVVNYSYTVEINTAKESELKEENYGGGTEFEHRVLVDDYKKKGYSLEQIFKELTEYAPLKKKNTYEYSKEFITKLYNTEYKQIASTTYSNLTVPGGTNYTENEIATPLITPSIKGHAQFSTDKGIGWFRSDDRQRVKDTGIYTKEQADKDLKEGRISQFEYDMASESFGAESPTETDTKTRRILEIQSDLFQKGRDKQTLTSGNFVGSDGKTYIIKWTNDNEFRIVDNQNNLLYNNVTKSWYETPPKDVIDRIKNITKDKENQFLQLLNKNSNWVTFFIKSIIQDSAKKRYEKVLFPKGETAAKIEGHETMEDEIIRIDKHIDILNNAKLYPINIPAQKAISTPTKWAPEIPAQILYQLDTKSDPTGYLFNTKEEARESVNNKLKILKKERNRYKEEGIEKLKPIEAFYEIKVGNILEKLFGKDNVKVITDEYGNTWNEVELLDDLLENFTIGSFKPRIPIPIPINNSLEELYREDVENSNNTCTFDIGK